MFCNIGLIQNLSIINQNQPANKIYQNLRSMRTTQNLNQTQKKEVSHKIKGKRRKVKQIKYKSSQIEDNRPEQIFERKDKTKRKKLKKLRETYSQEFADRMNEQKQQKQNYNSKGSRGQNVIGNLTSTIITLLKSITIKDQTLFSRLIREKTFVRRQGENRSLMNSYNKQEFLPISPTMSSNIINIIVVAYYYCKNLGVKDFQNEIIVKMLKKIKFNLVNFIIKNSNKDKENKQNKVVRMKRNLFLFYSYIQSKLTDIQENPSKIIKRVLAVSFKGTIKNSDRRQCRKQIQAIYQKVSKNQFNSLFILTKEEQNRMDQMEKSASRLSN